MSNVNTQNQEPYLVSDFIQEFRDRIGDTSKSVPPSAIITWLNTALRRVVRQDGMERLLDRRDTWELASVNKDGTPAVAWDLGNVGTVIDIRKLRLLRASGGEIKEARPQYTEYTDFFDCAPLPEQQPCGLPSRYTIEQLGSVNRLLFNRPPSELLVADMLYSAFHPRLRNVNDEIRISYDYMDIFVEIVIILQKIESTDQSTARALWEDVDVYTADLKELLAKRKVTEGYRRVARSF
jgi:hypothetical protein